MTEPASTPPRLTHLSDEKQRLDACNAALEQQMKELKEKLAELEAPLEEKAEATTAALKEDSDGECQRRLTCQRARMVAAVAPDGRDRAALRREQLASDRVKARQNRLSSSAGFSEGDRVRLYRPARNSKVTEASLGSTLSTGTLVRR
jgi:peptidoglycan hydrolase CwlO-like protein